MARIAKEEGGFTAEQWEAYVDNQISTDYEDMKRETLKSRTCTASGRNVSAGWRPCCLFSGPPGYGSPTTRQPSTNGTFALRNFSRCVTPFERFIEPYFYSGARASFSPSEPGGGNAARDGDFFCDCLLFKRFGSRWI